MSFSLSGITKAWQLSLLVVVQTLVTRSVQLGAALSSAHRLSLAATALEFATSRLQEHRSSLPAPNRAPSTLLPTCSLVAILLTLEHLQLQIRRDPAAPCFMPVCCTDSLALAAAR